MIIATQYRNPGSSSNHYQSCAPTIRTQPLNSIGGGGRGKSHGGMTPEMQRLMEEEWKREKERINSLMKRRILLAQLIKTGVMRQQQEWNDFLKNEDDELSLF